MKKLSKRLNIKNTVIINGPACPTCSCSINENVRNDVINDFHFNVD